MRTTNVAEMPLFRHARYSRGVARKVEVIYERASGGPRAQAMVRDASLGGVFIETAQPFDPGTLVSIEFGSGGGYKIQVDGRVISVQKSDQGDLKAGMAVRFLDLPDGAASTLGPMFQASRPPARTYLGVGATEPEIPKAPSVPKQVGAVPPPAPLPVAAAPPPPQATPPMVPVTPAPLAAPIPTSPGMPLAPAPYASQPPAPFPSARPPPVAVAMPAKRTSPIVWVLVALVVLGVLVMGAGVAGFLLLRGRPVQSPPPVTSH